MYRTVPRIARLICLLITALAPLGAAAQAVDAYGGWTDATGSNSSGYFRIQKLAGRYTLVTPDNHPFWSIGVNWANFGTGRVYESATLGYSAPALSVLARRGTVAAAAGPGAARRADRGFKTQPPPTN